MRSVVILAAAVMAAFAPEADISAATVRAVRAWVERVRTHQPGQIDRAVTETATLSIEIRTELSHGLPLFFSRTLGLRVVTTTPEAREIAEIAGEVSQMPGADTFLRQAATLHAEAAMHAEMTGIRPEVPPPSLPRADLSPLLTVSPTFLDRDGDIVGGSGTDWNWPFARSLLDLLGSKAADDPFVSSWYHAAAAFMLARGHYADAAAHVARAAVVLPHDARALFDRGCYAEIQGLPMSQVLLSDADLAELRSRRFGRRSTPLTSAQAAGRERPAAALGVPPEEVANADAERLFGLALKADPTLVEARVRRARLLDTRGRHGEARRELSLAIAGGGTPELMFYARLFAGRAAQNDGDLDGAAAHFAAALELFPLAQSALLASSQLALRRGDVRHALAVLDRLPGQQPGSVASPVTDPWRVYALGPGRDADALLRALASATTDLKRE